MNNTIIDLEEYKRLLELKNKLDNNEITSDNIELDDLDKINKIYVYEINDLAKQIEELKKENMRLKMWKGN